MRLPKTFRNIRRLEQLIQVLTKNGFGMIFDKLSSKKKHLFSPEKHLRLILEEMGGAFVKLGQLLSLRPDLIPQKYCVELEKLQDKGKLVPYIDIKEIIEKNSKEKINKIYKHIEIEALATGSIAQVHRAKLHNGNEIVLKVLKPNVIEQFKDDFELLKYLSIKLKSHLPTFINPEEILSEFERYTQNELNFDIELKNINKFRKTNSFIVPKTYDNLSKKEVLVMEYLDGISFSKKPYLTFTEKRKEKIVNNLSQNMMKQVFIDGLFHADPHPGNLFLMQEDKIALIDFGIIGELDDETRTILTLLLYSLVNKDLNLMIKSIEKLGISNAEGNDEFKEDLKINFAKYYDVSLDKIKFGDVLNNIISIGTKYNLKIPRKLIMLGKSVGTFESVCGQIYPKYNFVKVGKTFLEQNMTKIMSRKLFVSIFKKELFEYGDLITSLPKDLKKLIEIEMKESENSQKLEKTLENFQMNLNFVEIEFLLSIFSIFFITIGLIGLILNYTFFPQIFIITGLGIFLVVILFIIKKIFS
jgi:ubiquinone biosynthesis protein